MHRFFILLFFLPQVLLGQKEHFTIQHFSIKDGLPDNQTLHIEQDKDGFIWGNTIGALYRYDGYTFKVYRKQELDVSAIGFVNFSIDDKGLIWYFEFDQSPLNVRILYPEEGKITTVDAHFKGALPFPSREITNIYKDKYLGIVILTLNNGFYTYRNGQLKLLHKHKGTLEYSRVKGTEKGDIWYIHKDTLFNVNVRNEKTYTVQKSPMLDVMNVNGSIYVWYGTFSDVKIDLKFSEVVNFAYAGERNYEWIQGEKIDELEQNYTKRAFSNPVVDSKGLHWITKVEHPRSTLIAKKGDGEILFNEELPTYSANSTVNDNVFVVTRETFVDNQDNLWVSTDNGIYKVCYRQIPFRTYLLGRSTRGIFRLGDTLLVNHFLVSTIDLNKHKTTDLSLPLNRLTFFKDKHTLWVGSSYGITYWNKVWNQQDWTKTDWKQSDFYFRELKGYQNAIPFRPSKSDRLWVGTTNGLTYLDPKKDSIVAYTSNSKVLNTAAVRFFYENQAGTWVVTNQGLFLINGQGNVLKEITYPNGLPSNDLYHLHEDKDGIFWIGSADMGLIRWNPSTNEKKVFGRNQGFLNENIYAVYEDDYGFLWLPSDFGLIRFNKETYEVTTYLEEHGLPNNEFNTYSHFQDSQGILYFGGINGLIAFHPKDFIQHKDVEIPFQLIAFKVLSQGKENTLDVEERLLQSNSFTFYPNDKYFEVHFALLDFKNTKQRLYGYRVNGYDNVWRYTTDNFIRIHTLPYGKYQLQIKGQVDGTAWSKNQLIIDIEVPKPVYLQWWFITLLVATSLFLVYLFIKNRTKNLLQEQNRLESIVQKRTEQIELDKKTILAQAEALEELDKIKTNFFSNITHEFRTPLTLILGPTEMLYNEEAVPQKKKVLNNVLKNARHLLHLINQLLDLSKLENGKIEFTWHYGDIIGFTKELVLSFEPMAIQQSQEIIFSSNEIAWDTYFDYDKWQKIVFNLMSNAIKYSNTSGCIEVEIDKREGDGQTNIYLKVQDQGMGISPESLQQIFSRFYQVNDAPTRVQEGAGIGLALVKELIAAQGGSIEVHSKHGEGTIFEIQLPIPTGVVQVSPISTPYLNTFNVEGAASEMKFEDVSNKVGVLEILIIEDNADMRTYLSRCLEGDRYKISTANNGEEGIQKALETIPDLIISDVMMPIKDGYEVVSTLRNQLVTSHIPIILLTAKASVESRLEGIARGADAYLTKPFVAQELLIRVQKLVELRQSLQNRYQQQTFHISEEEDLFVQESVFIADLRTYILDHMQDEQMSVQTISQHFFMGRTQLYRKIKALTNETAVNFLLKVRLEAALTMIKEEQHTLSEIAFLTGFSSPSHFSSAFKRQFGKSPSEIN